MCQFLLSNKKYKYEEFFIDEYKELDEYMIYIEEKIFSIDIFIHLYLQVHLIFLNS